MKIQATITKLSPVSYDAGRDFSATSNPKGVWSYGWVGTIGGPFSLLAGPFFDVWDNGVQSLFWALTSNQFPATRCNTNSFTATVGSHNLLPHQIWYYPGADGHPENFGVLRFTTPAGGSGSYRIETDVGPGYNASLQSDSEFHVARNGVEIFSKFLGPTDVTGYTNVVSLAAGDTVDFDVGRGNDLNADRSGLKIHASLTLVSTTTAAPSIINQPTSQTATVGDNATFSVLATGTGPLSYQWRFNETNIIAGATQSSFTRSNVQLLDAGKYAVVISN